MTRRRSHSLGLPKSLAVSLIYLIIWQQLVLAVVPPRRAANEEEGPTCGGSAEELRASEAVEAQGELGSFDPKAVAQQRGLQQEDEVATGDVSDIPEMREGPLLVDKQ
jgi:hypothetical protein